MRWRQVCESNHQTAARLLRQLPRWLVQAGICLLLATGAEVAGPLLIKLFIDDYLAPRRLEWGIIAALAAGYLGLQVLSAAGFYLQSLRFNRIAQAVVQRLREQVFATAIRLPARYFDKHRSGSLISRITNDTEAIMNLYVQVIGLLVQKVVLLCGILLSMALLDFHLMLVCATLLPAVGAVMWLYQKLSVPVVRATQSLLSDINSRLNESLQGMPVIQAMVQERHFAIAFAGVNQQHWQARIKSLNQRHPAAPPHQSLLHDGAHRSAGPVCPRGAEHGGGHSGGCFTPSSAIWADDSALIEMTNQLNQLQQAMVAGERVFALLDETRESTDGEVRPLEGRVRFDGVGFSYDGEQQVLQDVSFATRPGQMLALVGHTGSGKSTIISLLMGFYPGWGSIHFDDHP